MMIRVLCVLPVAAAGARRQPAGSSQRQASPVPANALRGVRVPGSSIVTCAILPACPSVGKSGKAWRENPSWLARSRLTV